MSLPPSTEAQQKMSKVRALSDAIERQREELKRNPQWYNAAQLQNLQNQRHELMKTMPLTLVS